jgi:4-amino-4-deoxy-L-arabinose transferase-like glycosyltransferase
LRSAVLLLSAGRLRLLLRSAALLLSALLLSLVLSPWAACENQAAFPASRSQVLDDPFAASSCAEIAHDAVTTGRHRY